jgi:hypothetical protein
VNPDERDVQADAVALEPTPSPGRADRRRRRSLAADLTALAIVGVLLGGALVATGGVMYERLYSPSAFVMRYLDLLAQGRASDALAIPGVRVDSYDLDDAGLPSDASDALLRQAALAPLGDVRVVSTEDRDGVTAVTVEYEAGPHDGRTTFTVERAGSIGVAPAWRFATSPLAIIELTVQGAMQFEVNGFEIDKRQVLPEGVDADPLEAVSLLVFSPGLYSIAVDTPLSASPGVAVLSDKPRAQIPVQVQTQPTDKFVDVVQDKVESFLDECATQRVLQPTGCPFGFTVRNRILDAPVWSISEQPVVALEPDGADWRIRRTQAVAHIQVDIQSIFDGSVRHVDEDVPFFLEGAITVLPDGSASIRVASAD